MRELEMQMQQNFLEKKRKAEEELEIEMEAKKQKRMRELEEELMEEKHLKESRLQALDAQLQERMLLVAEEQTNLDDLREKSRNLQKQIEAEGIAYEQRAKATPPAGPLAAPAAPPDNTTVCPTPQVPNPADVLKERAREKLLQTAEKAKRMEATTKTPSPETSEAASATQTPTPPGVIVPQTDMRFTSSTHPNAWHFLYRLTKREDQCPKEIYEAWHAGW